MTNLDNGRDARPVFAWKYFYYAASVWALWLIPWMKHVTAETNLPPLQPMTRLVINAVLINLTASYFFLLKDLRASKPPAAFWFLWIPALISLCAVFPVFSGDLMEYLIRGRIFAIYGANPYLHFPIEFPKDLLYPHSSWKAAADAYGPVFMWIKSVPVLLFRDSVLGMVWTMKFITLCFAAAGAVFFSRIAGRFESAGYERPSALIYALNPLFLILTVIDGFNDVIMTALWMAAICYLLENKPFRCYFFWTMAFLVKYTVIVALPLMLLATYQCRTQDQKQKAPALFLGILIMGVAMTVVFFSPVWAGRDTFSNLANVGSRFYSNTIPYLAHRVFLRFGAKIGTDYFRYGFMVYFFIAYAIVFGRLLVLKKFDIRGFVRALAVVFLTLYICISSPLVYNYFLIGLPWLILSGWPFRSLLVTIYSAVGVFCYFKRISVLIILGALVYGVVLVVRWFMDRPARSVRASA